MAQPLDPKTKEWFLEQISFIRLWEQWTTTPYDTNLRDALMASLGRLGLAELSKRSDSQ